MTFYLKRLFAGIVIILAVLLAYNIFAPKHQLPSDVSPLPSPAHPTPITYHPLVTDHRPLNTDLEDIWHPRSITASETPATKFRVSELNFQLTGTIIEPAFSAAFILDTTSHKEDLYYEGETVCGWVIEKIGRSQVILRNADNKKVILPLRREQASSYAKLTQSARPRRLLKPDRSSMNRLA